jgi:hypothetical protein
MSKQATFEKLVADLPLAIDTYPTEQREDTLAALRELAEMPPAPAGKQPKPLYQPLTVRRPLPETAPKLIGLCGRPRAGKDVIAEYLTAQYEGVEFIGAFSQVILDEVNAYLAPFGHRITPQNKNAYRHLLQVWGFGRATEDPDYWTRQVARKIAAAWLEGARLVVVTGVRLPADVRMLLQLGGECWKVVRPNNPYQAEHAVEAGLDDLPQRCFRVVENPVEGDLRPYERNIERTLRQRTGLAARGA